MTQINPKMARFEVCIAPMTILPAAWKMFRIALHIGAGLATVVLRFPTLDQAQKEQRIMIWAQALLTLLAIKLVVNGKPPKQGPLLLVANHISWLDIYLILATCPARMIAKAQVQHWPLIGTLATATGTLFIQRESARDALRVVHRMVARLACDEVLAIFPEGTTSPGLHVLPFHANLFQAALAAGAPIQPLAIGYEDATTGHISPVACYVGNDTLLASIWRIARAEPLQATLSFGKPQPGSGRNRRALAADARAAVMGLRAAT